MLRRLSISLLICLVTISQAQTWRGWGDNNHSQRSNPPVSNQIQAAAPGFEHYAAVLPDGKIFAWGANFTGQTNTPAGTFKAIASGRDHTVAIRTDGTLAAWGSNAKQQLAVPVGTFTAVASKSYANVAIRTDGTLAAWGDSSLGQLNVPSGTFKAVAMGEYHGVAIRTDGTMACWGYNSNGQATAQSGNFIAVSAGVYHSVGIKTDGSIVTWGLVAGNELENVPVGTFTHIASSAYHNVAIRTDGTLAAWGYNSDWFPSPTPIGTYKVIFAGQHSYIAIRTDGFAAGWNNPTIHDADMPYGPFAALAAHGWHTVGLRNNGTLDAWGDLGPRTANTPTTGQYKAIAAGDQHSVAIKDDGTLVAWGLNNVNQLVVPPGTFTAVGAGVDYSIGLRTDGTLVSWGEPINNYGQLTVPPGTFKAIAVGGEFAIAIKPDDTLTAWGRSQFGATTVPPGTFSKIAAGANVAVGIRTDGTLASWGLISVAPPTGTFKEIAAGDAWAVAIRTNGTLAAWGNNAPIPQVLQVPGGIYTKVAAGYQYGIAKVSEPPTANPDKYFVEPNGSLTIPAPGVLENDVDGDTVTLRNDVDHGALTFNADGSFSYTPDNGFTGIDRFSYDATNDAGTSTRALVELHVWHPNLDRVQFDPQNVFLPREAIAGDPTTGHLTISGVVPSTMTATLAPSSSASVSWPASVTITAGTGTRDFMFPVTTQGPWFTDQAPLSVRATFNGRTVTGTLIRNTLPRLNLATTATSVSSLFETHELTLSVRLDKPVPQTGVYANGMKIRVFAINDTNAFKFPDSFVGDTAVPPRFDVNLDNTNGKGLYVTILPGETLGTVTVGMRNAGPGNQTRHIVVALGSDSKIIPIEIQPIVPLNLTPSTGTIDTPGGTNVDLGMITAPGSVTFGANFLDTRVALSSNNGNLTVPPSVRVNPDTSGASFQAVASQVGASANATITATRNAVSVTATVQLNP